MTTPAWMQPAQAEPGTAGAAIRCPVAARALLVVTGTDAADFLHAQLSTDIRALAPQQVRLSSYSDARGRLLGVIRLFATDDGFLLELPADSAEAVSTQLRRYVLRSRVAIDACPDDWAAFGVAGPSAAEIGTALGQALPKAGSWTALADAVHLAAIEGPGPRALLFGPQSALRPHWQRCDGLATADPERWDLLDIEAGLPCIHEPTRERFVAQMVNLDRLAALDFRKGCYPGQEVIARTQHLGRVKRRMFPLRAAAATRPPAPGEAVLDADGGKVGELVRAATHPDGGWLALAVLRLAAIDATLTLGDGTPVTRLDPPYPLDEAA